MMVGNRWQSLWVVASHVRGEPMQGISGLIIRVLLPFISHQLRVQLSTKQEVGSPLTLNL